MAKWANLRVYPSEGQKRGSGHTQRRKQRCPRDIPLHTLIVTSQKSLWSFEKPQQTFNGALHHPGLLGSLSTTKESSHSVPPVQQKSSQCHL